MSDEHSNQPASNEGAPHPSKQPGAEERASAPEPAHKVEAPGTAKDATKIMADWVAKVSFDHLPPKLVPLLRDLFLDWIGITAFAAGHAESSPDIRAAIRRLDPDPGPATAIGDKRRYSWLYAALLNGCHAHSLDFDDTNRVQIGHPGAPIFAAAFTESERLDTGGRAFLESVAVGYEIDCRLGAALGAGGYKRGFHPTSVAGIFGAVAAICKLRKLDAATIENAWGFAVSKAAGSMQYLANGAFNKRLHPGFAAHDALQCVALAEAGVRGAAQAFEGEHGLLHAYTDEPRPGFLLDKLGQDWVTLLTAIKPYPSCRMNHGPNEAATKLRDAIPEADRAEAKLTVEFSSVAYGLVGEPTPEKTEPKNTVDAQFSVYFQAAACFLYGGLNWQTYDRINDPVLRKLIKNVTVKKNDDVPNGGGIVTVEAGGKKETVRIDVPLGEPEHWPGEAKLHEKFMLLAAPVYGDELATRIADRIHTLGAEDSMSSIVELLQVHGGE